MNLKAHNFMQQLGFRYFRATLQVVYLMHVWIHPASKGRIHEIFLEE